MARRYTASAGRSRRRRRAAAVAAAAAVAVDAVRVDRESLELGLSESGSPYKNINKCGGVDPKQRGLSAPLNPSASRRTTRSPTAATSRRVGRGRRQQREVRRRRRRSGEFLQCGEGFDLSVARLRRTRSATTEPQPQRALETVRLAWSPGTIDRESRERLRGGVGIGSGERSRGRERDCNCAVDSNKACSIVHPAYIIGRIGRPRRSTHKSGSWRGGSLRPPTVPRSLGDVDLRRDVPVGHLVVLVGREELRLQQEEREAGAEERHEHHLHLDGDGCGIWGDV